MNSKKKPAEKARPHDGKTPHAVRRPAHNPPLPGQTIGEIHRSINEIKASLEAHAAHLRPLDRRRLNGVGLKIEGFIQRAYGFAMANPEFLPKYLSTEKLEEDHHRFVEFHALYAGAKQVQELLWNLLILSADMDYTNNLEFYASVREAAKRRIDGAETIHKDLKVFFRKRKPEAVPGHKTEKELRRDFNALLHNKKDGGIVIENASPKRVGGKHTIVDSTARASGHESFVERASAEGADEQFEDPVRFKEAVEREME